MNLIIVNIFGQFNNKKILFLTHWCLTLTEFDVIIYICENDQVCTYLTLLNNQMRNNH